MLGKCMNIIIERKVDQVCRVAIMGRFYEAPLFAIGERIRIYSNGAGEFMGELIDELRKPFKLKPTDIYLKKGNFYQNEPITFREQIEKQFFN